MRVCDQRIVWMQPVLKSLVSFLLTPFLKKSTFKSVPPFSYNKKGEKRNFLQKSDLKRRAENMSFLEFTVPPFPVFIAAGEGVFKKGETHVRRVFPVFDLLYVMGHANSRWKWLNVNLVGKRTYCLRLFHWQSQVRLSTELPAVFILIGRRHNANLW